MSDPRLNGSHLKLPRHDQYDATVNEMLDDRGPATADADPLVRLPRIARAPVRRESPPAGGTYTLINLADAKRHQLRVGINTIGRFPENDLVLRAHYISRRHCVVLVHATGLCEVYDTASRHGIHVNHHRVARTDLIPGDMLSLCDQRFLVAWVGPGGKLFESAEGSETGLIGGFSST